EGALLADLNSARLSIDLAAYSLSRPSVVRALLRAVERGVRVQVVLDCQNRFGQDEPVVADLEQAGVEVLGEPARASESAGCSGSALMHHKFIVVDQRVTWVGSTNLTMTGFDYNENAMLRLDSGELAADFLTEHAALRGAGEDSHRGLLLRRQAGRTAVDVVFLPSLTGGGSAGRDLLTGSIRR